MWMHQSRCSTTQEGLGVHDKKEKEKTIEELSEESKVPLEHVFNNHENCSAEWCLKTIAPEEGKTYNEKDIEFCCKQRDN